MLFENDDEELAVHSIGDFYPALYANKDFTDAYMYSLADPLIYSTLDLDIKEGDNSKALVTNGYLFFILYDLGLLSDDSGSSKDECTSVFSSTVLENRKNQESPNGYKENGVSLFTAASGDFYTWLIEQPFVNFTIDTSISDIKEQVYNNFTQLTQRLVILAKTWKNSNLSKVRISNQSTENVLLGFREADTQRFTWASTPLTVLLPGKEYILTFSRLSDIEVSISYTETPSYKMQVYEASEYTLDDNGMTVSFTVTSNVDLALHEIVCFYYGGRNNTYKKLTSTTSTISCYSDNDDKYRITFMVDGSLEDVSKYITVKCGDNTIIPHLGNMCYDSIDYYLSTQYIYSF